MHASSQTSHSKFTFTLYIIYTQHIPYKHIILYIANQFFFYIDSTNLLTQHTHPLNTHKHTLTLRFHKHPSFFCPIIISHYYYSIHICICN